MKLPRKAPTIRLESLAESHLPEIIAACRDWRELSQYGVPYWRPRSTAELRRKIASMAGPQPATEYNFVIIDETSDRMVGECSLHSIDWRNHCCNIGIFIWSPDDRHCGFGRSGLQELIEWGFGYLGLRRIEGRIVTDNVSSCLLTESLGFQLEGTSRSRLLINGVFKDTFNYALLTPCTS